MSILLANTSHAPAAKRAIDEVRFAVVVPTYNHGNSLRGVVEAILAITSDELVIVVDDGSTDRTAAVIEELGRRHGSRLLAIRHRKNRGKGRALQTGFARVLELGCTHAITVDADGQHHVPDILRLMAAATETPDDLIIGERQMDGAANVPAASRRGRDFSRFWLRIETGQDVPDSQCGMRIYPLLHVTRLTHICGRFDFETETITRHAWAGVRVRSVPVRCIYFPPAQRVSHFRPVIDTIRGVRMNVYLVMRRMLPLPFKRCMPRRRAVRAQTAAPGRKWVALKAFFREMMATGAGTTELSTALAVGIFIGITPLYGLHAIIAIYLARRLHINIPMAVIGTQISMPLLAPLWWFLSLQAGTFLLHGHWFGLSLHEIMHTTFREVLGHFLAACLGSLPVGLVIAVCGFFAMNGALRLARPVTREPSRPMDTPTTNPAPSNVRQQHSGGYYANALMMQVATRCLWLAYIFVAAAAMYFWIIRHQARRASGHYLNRTLGKRTGIVQAIRTYRHMLCFGQLLLDRALMLASSAHPFELRNQDKQVLLDAVALKRGLILLTAHCGVAEAGMPRMTPIGLPIHMVMYQQPGDSTERFHARYRRLLAGVNVITTTNPMDAGIKIMAALRRGEIVSMRADRTMPGKTIPATLLGGKVELPAGPFTAAVLSGAPVLSVYTVRLGYKRYHCTIRKLGEYGEGSRDEMLAKSVRDYAQDLEQVLRTAPLQWSNFYDYWREESAVKESSNVESA